MSDDANDDTPTDVSSVNMDAADPMAVSSSYKVLGELTAADGIGVLGQNNAGSGTPIGVQGVVPNTTDGYGLYTPDDAKIDGTMATTGDWQVAVDGNRALNLGAETADNSGNAQAGNVVAGYSGNVVGSEVVGATISGGGEEENFSEHIVYDDFAAIGGGTHNIAGVNNTDHGSETHVAIGGGSYNYGYASYATIGGGDGNTVWGDLGTIAGGGGGGTDRNEVFDDYGTVGGGRSNQAGSDDDTSNDTYATVPGGRNNTASGQYSFAAGRAAEAANDGTFVWADSDHTTFSSTGTDQFLVDAAGGVGIGTDAPATQLHVAASRDGAASPSNHVAFIENTTSGSADVLSLKINESDPLETGNNFITFRSADGNIGAIEGDGSGGVKLTSGSGDYAEYLPRLDPKEEIEPADIVGIVGDAVTKRTADADQALVVSDRSIVTGNSPGADPADRDGYEPCAFVGQVPVKVRGPVEEGDLVVPSGEHDGTGQAIAPAAYRPGDGPIVGRAWESDTTEGVTEVTVAVGLDTGEALAPTLTSQQETIEELEAEAEQKDARITDLEAENEQLRERLTALEDRVADVEGDGTAGPATADD